MEDDWGLQAVVRGCTSTTTTSSSSSSAAATTTTDVYSLSSFQPQENHFICFPDLFHTERKIEELHDLYKPFFPKLQPLSPESIIPISPLSVLGGLQDLSHQQKLLHHHSKHSVVGSSRCTTAKASGTRIAQHPRSKRRKNQMKRVCQVPAEGLSSDMWSWRKYGQKPIKGSPFPRGYYRCSTSKGCLARKQVERNRSDPTMFIVTYTGDHNHPVPTHRNSLAGSTRQKTVIADDSSKPSSSPPVSPTASHSPATENMESKEEREGSVEEDDDDDDEFGFVSDDFFMGLEEVAGPIGGNGFSDEFPASLLFTPTVAGGD